MIGAEILDLAVRAFDERRSRRPVGLLQLPYEKVGTANNSHKFVPVRIRARFASLRIPPMQIAKIVRILKYLAV
jgi:hypothetical protein